MIDLFNRLLQKHGSRLTLIGLDDYDYLEFRLHRFGIFRFTRDTSRANAASYIAEQWDRRQSRFRETAASKWLLAIAQGKTRDAEGKVA